MNAPGRNSRAAMWQSVNLGCIDHLSECPVCGDYAPPGAPRCECGARLFPSNTDASGRSSLDGISAPGGEEVIVMETPYGCTCGGNGICTPCNLAELDGDPFAKALAQAVDIVTAPANVRSLPGYSRKVT